mmetsp:Transcript_20376/g.56465  ORF Transcript_20376/g.56465 Transcript_20376/m.56465 type:complete len:338 (-) Transcript_20376:751-1764(-)
MSSRYESDTWRGHGGGRFRGRGRGRGRYGGNDSRRDNGRYQDDGDRDQRRFVRPSSGYDDKEDYEPSHLQKPNILKRRGIIHLSSAVDDSHDEEGGQAPAAYTIRYREDKAEAEEIDFASRRVVRQQSGGITTFTRGTNNNRYVHPWEIAERMEARQGPMAGMIFLCSDKSRADTIKYGVVGLPAVYAKALTRVQPGTVIFQYNITQRVMHGVMVATSQGGKDLVPHAFGSNQQGSNFPAQVLVKPVVDAAPLPEPIFRDILKDNYFCPHKFDMELSQRQVDELKEAFQEEEKKKRRAQRFSAPPETEKKTTKEGPQAERQCGTKSDAEVKAASGAQ